MKRIIAILLALLMVLSLAACGGGNRDKDKLIGTWFRHSPFSQETYHLPSGSVTVTSELEETWSFFKNGEFYYKSYGYSNLDNVKEPKEWWKTYVRHGTYSLKDGMIVFKYDNEDELEDVQKRPRPYAINEYTKELLFDVDEKGESNWLHSPTPKVLTVD